MRTATRFFVSFGLAALAACGTVPPAREAAAPPVAQVVPYEVKSPNGARTDNYYWLRDDTRQSPAVLDYLRAENAYADAWLAPTKSLQDKLYREIVGRLQEDDETPPSYDNGYWYYARFRKGQDYPVYLRRKGSLDAPEETLLNANTAAKGLAFSQVGALQISYDNTLLAYTQDTTGRRQYTLRFKDLRTGVTLRDRVENVEPDIVWANDNKTVLYVEKDPETLLGYKVKKHVLGTGSAQDKLVYEEQDRSFYVGLAKSKSDNFLFIVLQSTLVSEWRYADADDPDLQFQPVLPREPNHEYQVEHLGLDFVIRSNWQARNFRILRAPIHTSADKRSWKIVVPHSSNAFIEGYEVFKSHLVVNERSGGLLKLRVHPWDGGRSSPIAADEPAYTAQLGSTPELDSEWVRYSYTSLTTPVTVYDYNLRSGERKLIKRQPVLGGFDPRNYVTEYLQAPARDGTHVPVSLVYRKGFQRDGSAPLYQYAYGSYGYSEDPVFQLPAISLLDRGFVYAIAHVRGGQELGRAWYEDGKLLRKKNTFNDFIDVTEHLVRKGYAARDKVFAMGGSAGGLLMGAVVNRRPDLYRGIVAHVPFVDVVTTMLDESIPLTTNEFDEWGNPKRKAYYDYMLSYSPYDNVKAQNYPSMLVTTGLWDSQVQYYEPAKWVARLRATKTDANPLLFHVNMEAGHGGKSGRYPRFREKALEYAFILDRAGIAQ
ncbi:MAG: S9 family peptidase [Gammaproteobacteria bacterium]|nr:S9 family peptidase [Gammaproteobacteria bacterium]